MAEPYLSDLQGLADQWFEADSRVGVLDCRHFFSGAAAYRDNGVVASLGPEGLAFKVPGEIYEDVVRKGVATPFRMYPGGPIKSNYLLFPVGAYLATGEAVHLLLGEPY